MNFYSLLLYCSVVASFDERNIMYGPFAIDLQEKAILNPDMVGQNNQQGIVGF